VNRDELNFTLEFIDAMAARGSIRGSELLQVGTLRSRVLEEIMRLNDGTERNVEERAVGGEVPTTED
jgi:hypothetical protein